MKEKHPLFYPHDHDKMHFTFTCIYIYLHIYEMNIRGNEATDHKHFDHVGIMEVSLGEVISELEANITRSLEIEKMSEVLENFYKSLTNDTDYFLISLYIPTILLAVTANLIVIIVVIKFQYMRRYFIFSYLHVLIFENSILHTSGRK